MAITDIRILDGDGSLTADIARPIGSIDVSELIAFPLEGFGINSTPALYFDTDGATPGEEVTVIIDDDAGTVDFYTGSA